MQSFNHGWLVPSHTAIWRLDEYSTAKMHVFVLKRLWSSIGALVSLGLEYEQQRRLCQNDLYIVLMGDLPRITIDLFISVEKGWWLYKLLIHLLEVYSTEVHHSCIKFTTSQGSNNYHAPFQPFDSALYSPYPKQYVTILMSSLRSIPNTNLSTFYSRSRVRRCWCLRWNWGLHYRYFYNSNCHYHHDLCTYTNVSRSLRQVLNHTVIESSSP